MKNTAFIVDITHEDGTWIAMNNDLPFVTEAKTCDGVVERAWLIAPEMAVLNGLRASEDEVRLLFNIEGNNAKRRAVGE